MYNWSTDEKKFKKDYPADYKVWRLLQLINYGLDGEKLNLKFLKSNWLTIKNKVHDRLIKRYLTSLI